VSAHLNETETDSSEMTDIDYDRRLASLERWRDIVDGERLQIASELGEIKGLMTGVSTQMTSINSQLAGIVESLEERPSRTEFKETERQIQSIRAKATGFLSKMEIQGPGNMSFKLLGFSGVTIILALFLIVVIAALWFLKK
jgi:predicted  nucleic acid-binding Zn-ribbon protein